MRRLLVALIVLMSMISPALGEDRHVLIISVDGLAAFLLTDPAAPLPNIRKLADEGAAATQGMRAINPSITWPNHTSVVTGTRADKHGVLFNGILQRGESLQPVRVDPKKTKDELVKVPTLYDVAHAAGMTTGEVNWPCASEARTLHWSFPDAPDAVAHTTPGFRAELIAAGILPAQDSEKFGASTVARDVTWTRAMRHLILNHKPRVMLFHLLNVDATHHRYGAKTPAGYTANAYADYCVGQIVDALDQAGIRKNTTIFIVSDHGFNKVDKVIQANVELRKMGMLEVAGPRVLSARVQAVAEGGTSQVYFIDPTLTDAQKKQVAQALGKIEGVDRVLEPGDYPQHFLPDPKANPGMGDLVLAAKRGYAFLDTPIGENNVVPSTTYLGTHGYLAIDANMNAMFVASGAGIRKGASLKEINNIDVAPTAAALLGLKMPTAEGRVLTEILEK